jgi:alpha-tubulin suppressor-like RCC1 family protein
MRVAAGNLYSLALLREGAIRAWGHNASGKLGDGTTIDRLTPVRVINLLSSTAGMVAGHDHAAARLTNGTVWTWGANGNGQLGDNSTTGRATPQQVSTLSGAAAVAAGQQDTLTLTRGEALWSWGWNAYGQLGDGTLTERRLPVPIQVQ